MEIMKIGKLVVEKLSCHYCGERWDTTDASVEVQFTAWINGYNADYSKSIYFCNECSKNGFIVTPEGKQ